MYRLPFFFMKLSSYILLLVIFFSSVCFAADWNTADSGWVRIHYHSDDIQNLSPIFQSLHSGRSMLYQRMGVAYRDSFVIYLASKPAEFGEITGWKLPKWTGAVAMPGRRTVVLKSPRFSGNINELAQTTVHEFIHIALGAEIGQLPVWMNEGLAVFLSGEGYFDSRELAQAAAGKDVLSFREMEEVMRYNSPKAALVYQQSLSAVRYLVSEFGPEVLHRLADYMSNGADFEQAFFRATGLYAVEFEDEWMKRMESEYRWAFLKDLTYYLSLVFAPLALIAGLILWRRRRRLVRQWQREDIYLDDDFYNY